MGYESGALMDNLLPMITQSDKKTKLNNRRMANDEISRHRGAATGPGVGLKRPSLAAGERGFPAARAWPGGRSLLSRWHFVNGLDPLEGSGIRGVQAEGFLEMLERVIYALLVHQRNA